MKYPGGLILCLVLAALSWAQSAAQSSSGTVTKVDAAARSLTLKTDAGPEITVSAEQRASFRRVAPGATDLSKADTIQFGDIGVGDRVLARGKVDGTSVAATLIVVMSQSDIAKKQAAEQADWDRRGVTGLVTAASADSVTINVRSLAGVKAVVITAAPNAIVRRYAPDSVNFSDAKPSALAEIKTGDQVRARGDKSEDGLKISAVEIVSGNFKTIAGVILSIDATAKEMQVRDLDTKKPVTVRLVADSSVKKIQPQLAQLIAARLHGELNAPGGRGPEGRGSEGDGGRAPQGRGPDGGAVRGFEGGRGGGGGRGFGGGGGRGNADLQTMLDASPNITIADLKNGDVIVVSSTVGATAGKITAIKLLAGVEPILTKPGTQEMSLGTWDIGGGFGGGGGGQ